MFDAYLHERADERGEQFVEFDIHHDYDEYVDGKPRYDGVRSFLESRGIELPQGTPDDPPSAETVDGLGNRKNELVLELIHRDGVAALRGFGRLRQGRPRRRGCVARWCPRAPTAARCWSRPGCSTCSRRSSTASSPSASTCAGKPAPDTFLAAARKLGVEPARGGGVRGRARGVEAGRAGQLRARRRRRPRRPARGAARARRRHRRRRPRRAAGRVISITDHSRSSRGRFARPSSTSTSSPSASRCSRSPTGTSACAATSTRASRSACPGTYLIGLLRGPAAALRRERLRLPGGRADDRQRHQRQAHPAAGRRRAVRRPLRQCSSATSACSTSAPACCGGRASGPRRPARACASARRGWSRSPSARSRRSATRSSRSTGRRRVVVQSELVANEALPASEDDPRAAAARRRAAALASSSAHRRPRACWCTATKASGLRIGAAMDHVVDGPDGTETSVEAYADSARLTVVARTSSRASRCGSSSSSPTAGRRERSLPALRDQVAAALAEARHTGWDGLARRAARVPRRLLGPRRRRGRGRRRAAAGGPLRAVPHAPGRRARRAARDRRQGPDRPRLRRPHVLGHRGVRAAGADLHRAAGRRATRCAGASRRSTWRASAPRSSGSRARRSRGARSAARSARATGRRAPRRSTSTPTSPTRSRATGSSPATRSSSATSGSSCWSRPRGCGARSATTTRPGASASTASPGPTSTARSPTTTSTRT